MKCAKAPCPPYFQEGLEAAERLLTLVTPQSVDVLLLGDSLVAQWPMSLWSPHSVLNLGNGGDRIENVTWRLREKDHSIVAAGSIIVSVGTNNIWSGEDATQAVYTMLELLNQITRIWPRAQFRVLNISRFSQHLSVLNAQVDKFNALLSARLPNELIDVNALFNANPLYYDIDMIHFSLIGYRRLRALFV